MALRDPLRPHHVGASRRHAGRQPLACRFRIDRRGLQDQGQRPGGRQRAVSGRRRNLPGQVSAIAASAGRIASGSIFRNYYPRDERIPRLARLPDSRLVPIAELYTQQELKTSAAYNEALRRGRYRHGMNVRLDVAGGCSIVWSLADGVERGAWSSAQTEMIERLLPHVRQFVEVRGAMGWRPRFLALPCRTCSVSAASASFAWTGAAVSLKPTTARGVSCCKATDCSTRAVSSRPASHGQ